MKKRTLDEGCEVGTLATDSTFFRLGPLWNLLPARAANFTTFVE